MGFLFVLVEVPPIFSNGQGFCEFEKWQKKTLTSMICGEHPSELHVLQNFQFVFKR